MLTLLQPVENALRNYLIPALTEHFQCSDTERKLLSLPVKLEGLGIPNPCEDAQHEFENSLKLTANLTDAIIAQSSSATNNTANRQMVSKVNADRKKNQQSDIEQELTSTQSSYYN